MADIEKTIKTEDLDTIMVMDDAREITTSLKSVTHLSDIIKTDGSGVRKLSANRFSPSENRPAGISNQTGVK